MRGVRSDCVLNKGSVLQILKWTLYIAALIALATLAFPISVVNAQRKEQPLVFDTRIKPTPIQVVIPPPEPVKEEPKVIPKPKTQVKPQAPKPVVVEEATVKKRVNRFKPGYCTDYVARKVPVTWGGNANRWIANAKAQGYVVDKLPVAGHILVTAESGYGHVACIESVSGEDVTISEWNYSGRWVKTTRTLNINNPVIRGVIHI